MSSRLLQRISVSLILRKAEQAMFLSEKCTRPAGAGRVQGRENDEVTQIDLSVADGDDPAFGIRQLSPLQTG